MQGCRLGRMGHKQGESGANGKQRQDGMEFHRKGLGEKSERTIQKFGNDRRLFNDFRQFVKGGDHGFETAFVIL